MIFGHRFHLGKGEGKSQGAPLKPRLFIPVGHRFQLWKCDGEKSGGTSVTPFIYQKAKGLILNKTVSQPAPVHREDLAGNKAGVV